MTLNKHVTLEMNALVLSFLDSVLNVTFLMFTLLFTKRESKEKNQNETSIAKVKKNDFFLVIVQHTLWCFSILDSNLTSTAG